MHKILQLASKSKWFKYSVCVGVTMTLVKDERRKLFEQKVKELVEFLIEKDAKYAGEVPIGNIKDNAKTFKITPLKFCQLRINEKWNRIRQNIDDIKIVKEEFRDIWGYCLLGLLLIDDDEEEVKK